VWRRARSFSCRPESVFAFGEAPFARRSSPLVTFPRDEQGATLKRMSKQKYQPSGRARNRAQEWPYEREGYSEQPQAAYAAAPAANLPAPSHPGRLEAFLGSVIAGAGAVWTAQIVTQAGFTVPGSLTLNSHPIELTGIGILLWLHGKYRKATQVR
jgi:hypothetical protein